jgi:exosortase E/protease (VPEID-CTERM system)
MNARVENIPSFAQRLDSLPARLAMLVVLFVLEKLLVQSFIDYSSGNANQAAFLQLRQVQAFGFHFLVTCGAALTLFAYVRAGSNAGSAMLPRADTAIGMRFVLAHVALVAVLTPLVSHLYNDLDGVASKGVLLALCLLTALGAVVTAFAAMAPWKVWLRSALALGVLWVYAGVAALLSAWAMQWRDALWPETARITFELVQLVLQPLVPSLSADPAQLVLTTDNFAVRVSPTCSGLEGVGLMLMFCSAWLILFRSEYRFPRALLLIPAGLALIFMLNVVRIATLVLIGHAGYPGIAIYGFHSQAGWIAFNGSAAALVLLSRRSRWLSRTAGLDRVAGDNPTAAYLAPFLVILAAGTLAHAASSGFEYLYPLRLVACAVALACYGAQLRRQLDWHVSWRGPLAGCAVFVLWMLAARQLLPPAAAPAAIDAMSPLARGAWISSRVLAAVITVPIAEELAYRGFLMRRWLGPNFDSLPFAAVRWPLLAVTSVIFGLSHGPMWAAGIVAGGVYGALAIRTGRMGESVAAHATTNALLAAMVLLQGQWQLW